MRVFAIRPEPGFSATLEAGRALGMEMAGEPLFAVRPVAWQPPDPASFDVILAGSANAFRHAGTRLQRIASKPVHAVGKTTAQAALSSGLPVANVGEGGLQSLLDGLAGRQLRILRLTGRHRVPLDPPAGIDLVERIVYESAAMPMPPELAGALSEGGIVLLHSARAVQHLGDQCDAHGVPRHDLHIAALGARIAEAAGPGWASVHSAERPDEAALLALARHLCHRM